MGKAAKCQNCGAKVDAAASDACAQCGMPLAQGKLFAPDALPKRRDPRAGERSDQATASVGVSRRPRTGMIVVLAFGAVAAGASAYFANARVGDEGLPERVLGVEGANDVGEVVEAHARATNSVVSVPAPEPEPEPTAEFTFHGTRSGYRDAFYVNGVIENTSPIEIAKPKLVIVMLDEGGNEVGTASGYALAESLMPQEKSYISAIVSKPPAHTDLRFEVVARKASYVPKLASGLMIKPNAPVRNGGLVEMSGVVENTGPDAAKFVNVRVLSMSEDDKLLGVSSTYAGSERLESGKSARFSLNVVSTTPPAARYEYHVQARVAD